ncbi:MAG TPA: Clp protease N-terminal domain-containing protein [Solirubrobacteraceae bacterium]|nr:Clp protease N-terminal domain-containing protein [Solirubrobacteraceae bacterium]
MRGCLDRLEAEHVDAALEARCSWRVIADALGVSRQAAHRRHTTRIAAASQPARTEPVAGNRLVITGAARVAVVMARQEAAGAQSPNVGTEHLLAGLVRQRDGLAADALGTLGVTLDKVRHCAQASADRAHGDPETADHPLAGTKARLPFSRRGRESLEQSLREAVRLGDDHLGVEHLLLALLRDPGSRAVECLKRLDVTPAMVEEELQRLSERHPRA